MPDESLTNVDTPAPTLSEIFKNVNWTELLVAFMEGLSEGLEKDYMRFLGTYGWVPAPDLLFSAMEPVVNLVQSGQTQRAERLYRLWCLRNYDTQRLQEILDEWKKNPLMTRRYPIVKDAIEAHIAGLYTLSVPVLMAQIEGFMWSIDQETEWINQKKLKQLFTNPMFGIYKKPMERFVDSLFSEFRRDNLPFPSLNRNAVLHGVDTGYGTIKNSLQLIMIMQLLAFMFDRELPPESLSYFDNMRTPQPEKKLLSKKRRS